MIHTSPHAHHNNKAKESLSSPAIGDVATTTTTKKDNSKDTEYVERIELVAMKNKKDAPFIRILISKSLYKPGVVIAPSSNNNNKNNNK